MDQDILGAIITLEWHMFQAVNEGSARADCQDDYRTFEGMRRAQFAAWPDDAAARYFDDLTRAAASNRNLVAEKYIRMMRTTEPARYARLAANIPQPGERAETLARAINARLLAQTETLRARYPYVSGAGRPLRAAEDFAGVTSIETYQLGELLTYSERTLAALLAHVEDLEARGASLAEEILKNTVRFYGYESLERAETAQRVHAANQPGELSPGCAQ